MAPIKYYGAGYFIEHYLEDNKIAQLDFDSLTMTGIYRLPPNQCIMVAEGINSFTPGEMGLEYLEIWTTEDTAIYNSQTEMYNHFKEVDKHEYVLSIN